MWPTKSNMFPVWPFIEKKGPDILFITLSCLRSRISTRPGSTLLCLCRIRPLWSISQHPPCLGSVVCMDHKCLRFRAGCRPRESDKQSEGRREVELGCPSAPVS